MKGKGFTSNSKAPVQHANTDKLTDSLEALLAENNVPKSLISLSHEEIIPDPDQPRKQFDEASIKELSASISEHGQAQPIVVKDLGDGKYQIIVGERRWRAAQYGDFKLDAVLRNDLSSTKTRVLQVLENVKREEMTIEDTATAYVDTVALIIEDSGCNKVEAASTIGITKTEYYRWESICNGVRDENSSLKQLFEYTDDISSLDQARKIEKKNPEAFLGLIKKIKNDKLKGSIRDAIQEIASPKPKVNKPVSIPSVQVEGAERVNDEIVLTILKGKARTSVVITPSVLSLLNGLMENE